MILVKNLKILRHLFLFQKGFGLIFDDVQVKKRRLSRLQKCYYNIVEILAFFKGLTYKCGQKFEISSEFVSVSKRH